MGRRATSEHGDVLHLYLRERGVERERGERPAGDRLWTFRFAYAWNVEPVAQL